MKQVRAGFSQYGIYLVLLLGFLVRVLLLQAGLALDLRSDENSYTKLAALLSQNPVGYSDIFRPPLYPTFLAFSFAAFGESRFATGVLQALVSTLNVALIYAFTKTLFHRNHIALFAAALFALQLELITLTRLYLADTLSIFLSTLGFWLLLKYTRARNALPLIGAGIILALAALTRELIGLFAILVVPVWLALVLAPKWNQFFRKTLAVTFGLAIVFIPWVIRNYGIEPRFVLISTSGEYNLARDNWREEAKLGIVPNLDGMITTRDKGKLKIHYPKQVRADLRRLPPAERGAYPFQRAYSVISHAPLQWLLLKTHKLAKLFEPPSPKWVYTRLESLPPEWNALLSESARIMLVSIALFAILGMFAAQDNAPKLLILLYLLFSLAVFIATHYMGRYRLPLLTLLLPYSAYGVFYLLERMTQRLRRGVVMKQNRFIQT